MYIEYLESLPITGIFAFITVVMLISCELGFQFGEHAKSHRDKDAPTSLGPMVGGLLGMLAFVLAFSFSMAASQHDLRKQNVLNEANAVGTAYLRADLLDKQYQLEVKRLLKEYLEVRIQAASGGDVDAAVIRSIEIHKLLWDQVISAAIASPGTNTSLMLQSINDLIDMHEKRLFGALYNRMPGSVWIALAAITILTMVTMGIQVGFTGKRRLAAVIPLSLAFAVLVTLVVDLNRPGSGLIKVSQQSLINLQSHMMVDTE